MNRETVRGAMSIEKRLTDLVGKQMVAGGKFLLAHYPWIVSDISVVRPMVQVRMKERPTGALSTPVRTDESAEDRETHLNADISEAIGRATPFAWSKNEAFEEFMIRAATHDIPVKDYQTAEKEGTGRVNVDPSLVNIQQVRHMRYVLIDESTSMAGGGDILAELITSAHIMDSGQSGIPLVIKYFNQSAENGGRLQVKSAQMQTPLEFESVARILLAYNPEGKTPIAQALLLALSDLAREPLAPGQKKELILVTDGEVADGEEVKNIAHVVNLAKGLGVAVKVIYLQDKDLTPLGPTILKDAGCEVRALPLDVIKDMPKDMQDFVLNRTGIHLKKEERIDIEEAYDKFINLITYLCGATAIYLASGGTALFVSEAINPDAPGINIPPWNEHLSGSELDLLLALTIGMQVLTFLLIFRKKFEDYVPKLVDVPEMVRKIQQISLFQKEQLYRLRQIEAGTMIVRNGETVVTQKGEKWETESASYQVV